VTGSAMGERRRRRLEREAQAAVEAAEQASTESAGAGEVSPAKPLTRRERLAQRRRLAEEAAELPPVPTRRQLRETGQLLILPADDEPIRTGEELPEVPFPDGVAGYRTLDPTTGELTAVLPVPGTESSTEQTSSTIVEPAESAVEPEVFVTESAAPVVGPGTIEDEPVVPVVEGETLAVEPEVLVPEPETLLSEPIAEVETLLSEPIAESEPAADSEPVALDAGPVALDAGPVALDAGPVALDAGPVALDAGRDTLILEPVALEPDPVEEPEPVAPEPVVVPDSGPVAPYPEHLDLPEEDEDDELVTTFSGQLALIGEVTRTPAGEFVKPVTGQFPLPKVRPPTAEPEPVVNDKPAVSPSEPRFFTPIQILILSIVIAVLGVLIGFAIAESRYGSTSSLPVNILYSTVVELTQGTL
jgi:hypothetical protein